MTTLTTPPPSLPDGDVAAERAAEAAQWDRDTAWASATMQERFAADIPAAVRMARRMYVRGSVSYRRLGEEFGVSASTIKTVVQGKTWRWLD